MSLSKTKILTVFVIGLFIGSIIVPSISGNEPVSRGTIYVDNDASSGWYDATHVKTIQEGVDNASAGDTVFVYNGTYYENVVVNKTINLTGEDKNGAIIDGGGSGDVVYVTADRVNISNFKIQNCSTACSITSNYTNISHNIISNNSCYGVYVYSSQYDSHNIITNNIIRWNSKHGIKLEYSCSNVISNNIINSNGWAGIWLWWCIRNNTISKNIVTSNGWEDISIHGHGQNSIFGNDISDIILSSSNNNKIYRNNMENAYDNGINIWDNGYPSGGNYWEGYAGSDDYHGPNQNIPPGDDIGDTPYTIPSGNNQDGYPLIYPLGENPPIANFTYSGVNRTVSFNASSSWDRDGTIIFYEWTFGDETNGTGMIVNHTYYSLGDYYVTLNILDNDGKSDNLSKLISVEEIPPEIIDDTQSTGYTGDSFIFEASITDNVDVSTACVEYWYGTGTHTNVSMDNVGSDYWERDIVVDDILDTMHYIIYANDLCNNWNTTCIKNVTICDNDKPEITNVHAVPSVKITGKYVNTSTTVIDNIEVDEVYLHIEYPDSSIENFSITQNRTGDTYFCNKTYNSPGTYMYCIWVNDTGSNGNISSNYIFEICRYSPTNIVIGSGETFMIENCTFIQNGNITVKSNGTLIINNAVLRMNITFADQYTIYGHDNSNIVFNSSTLETVTSDTLINLTVRDTSSISTEESTFNDVDTLFFYDNTTGCFDNSTVYGKVHTSNNSYVSINGVYSVTPTYTTSGINCYDNSTIFTNGVKIGTLSCYNFTNININDSYVTTMETHQKSFTNVTDSTILYINCYNNSISSIQDTDVAVVYSDGSNNISLYNCRVTYLDSLVDTDSIIIEDSQVYSLYTLTYINGSQSSLNNNILQGNYTSDVNTTILNSTVIDRSYEIECTGQANLTISNSNSSVKVTAKDNSTVAVFNSTLKNGIIDIFDDMTLTMVNSSIQSIVNHNFTNAYLLNITADSITCHDHSILDLSESQIAYKIMCLDASVVSVENSTIDETRGYISASDMSDVTLINSSSAFIFSIDFSTVSLKTFEVLKDFHVYERASVSVNDSEIYLLFSNVWVYGNNASFDNGSWSGEYENRVMTNNSDITYQRYNLYCSGAANVTIANTEYTFLLIVLYDDSNLSIINSTLRSYLYCLDNSKYHITNSTLEAPDTGLSFGYGPRWPLPLVMSPFETGGKFEDHTSWCSGRPRDYIIWGSKFAEKFPFNRWVTFSYHKTVHSFWTLGHLLELFDYSISIPYGLPRGYYEGWVHIRNYGPLFHINPDLSPPGEVHFVLGGSITLRLKVYSIYNFTLYQETPHIDDGRPTTYLGETIRFYGWIKNATNHLDDQPVTIHGWSGNQEIFTLEAKTNSSGYYECYYIIPEDLSFDYFGNITVTASWKWGIGETCDQSPELVYGNDTIMAYAREPNSTYFYITEIILPEISEVDTYPNNPESGEWVKISAKITDNIEVDEVYLHIDYPDGSFRNFSIIHNRTGDTYFCWKTYDQPGIHTFHIWANDSLGNSNTSDIYTFTVQDTIPPIISNVTTEPDPQNPGGFVNITCDVSDNVDVDEVYVNISYPDNSYSNESMLTGSYYFNQSYLQTGIYDYFIWANDTSGNSNKTTSYSFRINNPPNASYTYEPSNPSTFQTIYFNSTSTDIDGIIANWTWTLGDDNISYLQNPMYNYSDNGDYNVCLTVEDDDGATDTICQTVIVYNIEPIADFTWSPTCPTILDMIQFTDQSTDPRKGLLSWYWDFGDGNTSNEQNPTHQYSNPTIYTVCLTIWDDDGATNTTCKEIIVTGIDINQSTFNRGFPIRHAIDGDWGAAQNFTLTLDTLTSVDIYLRKFGTPEFNLTVELRKDHPQGTLLDTVVFTPDEIASSWTWLNVDFNDVNVGVGSDIFIVLPPVPSGVTTSFGYEWGYAFGNQYDDGSFWFTRDGGGLWRDLPTMYEFVFRTYGYS